MFKKILVAPFLGILFVVFLPVVGFVVTAAALGQYGLKLVTAAAGRAQRWSELG